LDLGGLTQTKSPTALDKDASMADTLSTGRTGLFIGPQAVSALIPEV